VELLPQQLDELEHESDVELQDADNEQYSSSSFHSKSK
jgi:hypothetical protein